MTPAVTCKGGAIFFNAKSGEHAEKGNAGATWFDNPPIDTQSYPSKYHSEDSYKAWLQTDTVRQSITVGAWPAGRPQHYTSTMDKVCVDTAEDIASRFIQRSTKNTLCMQVVIGPNNDEDQKQFIEHNNITSCQMFGHVLRQALNEMIIKFGLDGERLRVTNMEPSSFRFNGEHKDHELKKAKKAAAAKKKAEKDANKKDSKKRKRKHCSSDGSSDLDDSD